MGTRGPVPKRTSQRLGHLTKTERASSATIKAVGMVEMPAPDARWDPLARDWYLSLSDSAQSEHFEPSDWQAARLIAAELSRMLESEFPNAALFGRLWSAMGELMTTEGARRRLKVEIDRRPAALAPVSNLADHRAL